MSADKLEIGRKYRGTAPGSRFGCLRKRREPLNGDTPKEAIFPSTPKLVRTWGFRVSSLQSVLVSSHSLL